MVADSGIHETEEAAMTAITRTDGQSQSAAGARLVHMRSHGGHRQEYQELFAALFGLSLSTGPSRSDEPVPPSSRHEQFYSARLTMTMLGFS